MLSLFWLHLVCNGWLDRSQNRDSKCIKIIRPCAWFLEIAFVPAWVCVCVCVCVCVRACVCLSVCLPPRALITSDTIWCDIGRVWMVKQVSWLYPAFKYFIWHLSSINWIVVAILTQYIVNACQRKLRWCSASYKRTTGKTEHSFIKVSGRMLSKWI